MTFTPPPHALAAGDQLMAGAEHLTPSEALGFVQSVMHNLSDMMIHVLDEHEDECSSLVLGLLCASGLTMTLSSVALEHLSDELNVVPVAPPQWFRDLVENAVRRAQS